METHVNDSEQTIRAYQIFIESYLHQFSKPGSTYIAANLEDDPRVYAFLRQKWEEDRNNLRLDELLVDSLILYALEGTDPEKNILRTKDEILDIVRSKIKFEARVLHDLIDSRLKALSTKQRKINHHHKENAYCLRYEERLAIADRNLRDDALYETFVVDTKNDLETYLDETILGIKEGIELVEALLHDLFSKQGLEFTDFVLHRASKDSLEKNLPDLVSAAVESSAKVKSGKPAIKSALLATIRHIVYNGTRSQKEFVSRLSHTYMLMFLLQCDPKLATYFAAQASKLKVYVDASIIIPALSEHYLEQRNRRYCNLLKGARQHGVELVINEVILGELSGHFRMIQNAYERDYQGNEEFYTEEIDILLIEHIMIRAFFYARMKGEVKNWTDFLGTFVSQGLNNLHEDLIGWLKEEFGIVYQPNSAIGIVLDPGDVDALKKELAQYKVHQDIAGRERKALNDARVILTIFNLREKNNEVGEAGIHGYKTWWLSSDITTHRAVRQIFGSRYPHHCYMRPDFLYNYIALAPSKGETEEAFAELFPTLVGINISFRVPDGVVSSVHSFIADHKNLNRARLKAALREFSNNLKSDPSYWNAERTKKFFERRKAELAQM